MFKKDQIVVYRLNVCCVDEILPEYRDGKDYYKLSGVHDKTLTIKTPVKLADSCARLIISSSRAKKLLDNLADYDDISVDSDTVQSVCEAHIKKGSHEDLLIIVKSHYNQRHDTDKICSRWSEKDKKAFRNAEKVLYREIGAALGETAESAKRSVYERIKSQLVGVV